MTAPVPPRKRTQFASFLTDAASDLSGFEARSTKQPAMDASTTSAEVALHGDLTEKSVPPLDRTGSIEQRDLGTTAPAKLPPSGSRSERQPGGPLRPANETSAPSPKMDVIKISVKVDADTFLELKRALHLRETLQDFCLNAITRELTSRVGKP